MADIEEILTYYANLLIVQYHSKEKAVATIRLLVETLVANGLVFDVRDGFNVSTAVGVQLDIIGKYVGVDRFFSASDFGDSVFGFADATDVGSVSSNITGFDDADAPTKSGIFQDAQQIISTGLVLSDDAYRIIIGFKILQNNIDHSDGAIDEALFDTFGTTLFAKDNYDMTMTYFAVGVDEVLLGAIIQKDLLLRPMAVGVDAVITEPLLFAMADATQPTVLNPYMVGFNDATTGFLKQGAFLNVETGIL